MSDDEQNSTFSNIEYNTAWRQRQFVNDKSPAHLQYGIQSLQYQKMNRRAKI